MAKFHRKFRQAYVVDAVQWQPSLDVEGVVKPNPKSMTQFYPFLRTKLEDQPVQPGDWIITTRLGEKYVCKNSVFRLIYDPLES